MTVQCTHVGRIEAGRDPAPRALLTEDDVRCPDDAVYVFALDGFAPRQKAAACAGHGLFVRTLPGLRYIRSVTPGDVMVP